MSKRLNLDYLSPQTARGYSFVTIPHLLIVHEAFDPVDYGAKILFGLMLNRASLSAINADSFTDQNGKLYIIYTNEQVMKDMRCSDKTATKMLRQLEEVGLIERKRRGLGKPSLIYMKDFASVGFSDGFSKKVQNRKIYTSENTGENVSESVRENVNGEGVGNVDFTGNFQNRNIYGSEGERFTVQKAKDLRCSKIDYNQPDYKSINQSERSDGQLDGRGENGQVNVQGEGSKNKKSKIISSSERVNEKKTKKLNMTSMTYGTASNSETSQADQLKYEKYTEVVKSNIDYDYLRSTASRPEVIDEMLEVIVETVCSSKDTVRVSGEDKPQEHVKGRLLKLAFTHIEYVLECLMANTTKVHNAKAYLLTTLYNAPSSMANYYQQEVNYDLHGGGRVAFG